MPDMIKNRREVLRQAFEMRPKITALLREGPQTIPALARILQAPSQDVMVWLMAMLRYNEVEAAGKAYEEGYFSYALKESKP